ncbi:MAG TPA: polysaccharide deacetylase family protein [Ferruginibacter sp.]|nr:polysaccharide deacetylase family protein [Ferruginibacter sp.]
MSDNTNDTGVFVISLDFELLWGVWDVTTKKRYGANILGVKEVIPQLIDLFDRYHIKVTFATVGFLFARNKEELLSYVPSRVPVYANGDYNVYKKEFPTLGSCEKDDPYHFGYSLFEQVKQSAHEIGTHTFSHYFCLEKGQSKEDFEADIVAAKKIAAANNVTLSSIVFPRNQVNPEYLSILQAHGIHVYRHNQPSWIYKPRTLAAENIFIRICRFLDAYFPLSGHNTYPISRQPGQAVNIPASRFLKPYNRHLAWLEKLKLNRILTEMTLAAQKKHLYHLWWHPHNFGVNIPENMANLTVILDHYAYLNKTYGFRNSTMKEAAGV